MTDRKEMILSEEYADLILPSFPSFLDQYQEQGAQLFNDYYGMIHYPIKSQDFLDYYGDLFFYYTIPKLYTLLDTVNLDAAGISAVQNQPVLNLQGRGILLGFLDTGIDYTHPAFRIPSGETRIAGIWDQTIQTGNSPYDLEYGTAYTRDEINQALKTEDPFALVPTKDENGHGTFLAGIAAGSALPENEFKGAAPQADLAVVKLKEAKQYLKDLFYFTGSVPAYQMTDLMMGVRYLLKLAQDLEKPLVICMALGTNQGSHSGSAPLDNMFGQAKSIRGFHVTAAAGNEAGKGHHYYGNALSDPSSYHTIEVLVEAGTQGFCMELWGQPPEIYSVGFESPLGEVIQKLPTRISYSEEISFVLEKTKIFVSTEILQTISGNQMIFIRFSDPTPGSWKIRVYTGSYNGGSYHIWLPVTGASKPDVRFLEPNPDTTLTAPSDASSVITVAAYNAYNNSLFLNSSRGYTRTGIIKPDFAAPGVNVMGPTPQGGFTAKTGTSVSAAFAAGACALLMEWGMEQTPPKIFTTQELKALFIRGAGRSGDKLYPNREWGYGTMDVYQVFTSLSSS